MLENLGAKIILNTPKSIDKIVRTLKINYSHVNDVKDLKFTRGMLHLIEGEFEEGWKFYELIMYLNA